jgi:uncharacterized membrane protein YfcA
LTLITGLAIYLGIGALSGLLAGLFGIGGGLIIVPALNAVFAAGLVEIAPEFRMHVAIGSSLGVIVFTALASTRAHHRLGSVLWPAFRGLVPGVLAGGLLGAAIASVMGTRNLEVVFGCFALLMAWRMASGGERKAPGGGHRLPGAFGQAVAGLVIGTVSALAGIGGGVLTVPWLAWNSVPLRTAVGTAAACTLPVALAGSLGYFVTGWGTPLPAGATGYLYWPAIAAIALASVFTAPVGARLAHRLPVRRLRQLFAGLLVVVAVDLLLGGR